MRDGGAELVSDAVDLKAQQHIGLDHVDLVATLHGIAVAVARGAIADGPRIATAQWIGVCREMATLELLNQLDGRGQISLLAVLAPRLKPCAVSAHRGVVAVGGEIGLELLNRGGLMRLALVILEELLQ